MVKINVLLLQNRSVTSNMVDKCCWMPDGINVMLMWSSSAYNRNFTFFEDTYHWCELVQNCPLQSQGSCEHGWPFFMSFLMSYISWSLSWLRYTKDIWSRYLAFTDWDLAKWETGHAGHRERVTFITSQDCGNCSRH